MHSDAVSKAFLPRFVLYHDSFRSILSEILVEVLAGQVTTISSWFVNGNGSYPPYGEVKKTPPNVWAKNFPVKGPAYDVIFEECQFYKIQTVLTKLSKSVQISCESYILSNIFQNLWCFMGRLSFNFPHLGRTCHRTKTAGLNLQSVRLPPGHASVLVWPRQRVHTTS